jgi:acetyl-CoA C-acetyltransferase
MKEVFFVGTARTAIGSFGGSLKNVALTELATIAVRGAIAHSGADSNAIGHVILGNVIPTEPRDAYLARIAAIGAGIPQETPAFNVNRLCGSGLQAIVSAAQGVMLGEFSLAIAGGAESMSRGPYMLPSMRWGERLGDGHALDYMNGILHDPWKQTHMGITAENVAKRYGISREVQDELAHLSQYRANVAITQGRFLSQIVPVEIQSKRSTLYFDTDENVRPEVTLETLAGMRPIFEKDGTVTAGNSSSLNDGAAAVMLADSNAVKQQGLTPLARLVAYGHAGVDPDYMGMGPVPATILALKRACLSIQDIDVVESNEAFAAQACAVAQQLEMDPQKVNPNGSGISLGHPVGATGAIILIKAIHELHRSGGRYALVTMCIGGGQGIAAIIERV